jgi:hypothetical protein
MMATSNNPLAPNPVTDIDGPDIFPPLNRKRTLERPFRWEKRATWKLILEADLRAIATSKGEIEFPSNLAE